MFLLILGKQDWECYTNKDKRILQLKESNWTLESSSIQARIFFCFSFFSELTVVNKYTPWQSTCRTYCSVNAHTLQHFNRVSILWKTMWSRYLSNRLLLLEGNRFSKKPLQTKTKAHTDGLQSGAFTFLPNKFNTNEKSIFHKQSRIIFGRIIESVAYRYLSLIILFF